jgi:hypothetical protein
VFSGLVTSVALASGSLLKAFTMVVLGLLLGLVGTDVETGTPRFTVKRIVGPVLRGTGLGSLLGILLGGGAMLASFASYTMEKKLSRNSGAVAEGIDVDIRIGGLREPHLYAQRLAENQRVLCAAPSYLTRHGRPDTLAELVQHRCLVIRERDQAFGVWHLHGPAGMETVKVRSTLSANDGEIIHRWARDGYGIMLRSFWDVAEGLSTGQLVRVLEGYSQEADVWAVYPTRLSRSPKVRMLVCFLVDRLAKQSPPRSSKTIKPAY